MIFGQFPWSPEAVTQTYLGQDGYELGEDGATRTQTATSYPTTTTAPRSPTTTTAPAPTITRSSTSSYPVTTAPDPRTVTRYPTTVEPDPRTVTRYPIATTATSSGESTWGTVTPPDTSAPRGSTSPASSVDPSAPRTPTTSSDPTLSPQPQPIPSSSGGGGGSTDYIDYYADSSSGSSSSPSSSGGQSAESSALEPYQPDAIPVSARIMLWARDNRNKLLFWIALIAAGITVYRVVKKRR